MRTMTFPGERLREVRVAADLSLEAVSARLGIGMSTLHGWERQELPRARFFAVLRAIGKLYRERTAAYRQARKAATE